MLEFRFELGERLLRMDQVNEAIQAFQRLRTVPSTSSIRSITSANVS